METPQVIEEVADRHHEPVKIVVNGRPKEVTEKELTFKEVVDLAYNNDPPTRPERCHHRHLQQRRRWCPGFASCPARASR